MSNFDASGLAGGDEKDQARQQSLPETYLTADERKNVKRFLRHPEDFPPEFGAWLIDHLNVNGLDIPVNQLRGFSRYIYDAGTVFPTSPQDGQPFSYVADADNGIIWNFRFSNNVTDSYPWIFEGGQPLYFNIATEESSAATAYADLSTVSTLTIPLKGIYAFGFGASYINNSHDSDVVTGVKYSSSTPIDAESIQGEGIATTGGAARVAGHREIQATVTSVPYSAKLQYKVGSSTGVWRNRYLRIAPLRVAAT